MPKMIATMRQRYDGQTVSKNDVFDVKDKDVRLLKALGRVAKLKVAAMSAENTSALIPNPIRSTGGGETHQHAVEAKAVEHEIGAVSANAPVPPPEEPASPVDVIENVTEAVPEIDPESEFVDLNLLNPPDNELEAEMPTENPVEHTEYSKMLRDKAMFLGIRVDGRWSDARVQREIDEYNKRTYQTTALHAE